MALNVEDKIATAGSRSAPQGRGSGGRTHCRGDDSCANCARPGNSPRRASRHQLGISQDGVSRLEQRSDLLLSTLRKTVEAMGRQPFAHRADFPTILRS